MPRFFGYCHIDIAAFAKVFSPAAPLQVVVLLGHATAALACMHEPNPCLPLNTRRAKIQYTLEAQCVVPGMLTPNIRWKQYLNVHQVAMLAPVREIKAWNSQKVTCCCCVPQVIMHAALLILLPSASDQVKPAVADSAPRGRPTSRPTSRRIASKCGMTVCGYD